MALGPAYLIPLTKRARNGDIVYVRPEVRALLIQAERYLGEGLAPSLSKDSGWRSYLSQKAKYAAYKAGTGPVASNPDTGGRFHMRGAAIDLYRTDAAAQNAMLKAGFIRDPAEAWHWNHPEWSKMPIIPTLQLTPPGTATSAAPAGGSVLGSTSENFNPTNYEEESDMQTIRNKKTGHIYNVAPMYIKHLTSNDQVNASKAIQSIDDKYHDLDENWFWGIIDAYGIPRNVVYGQPGVVAGNVWSKQHDLDTQAHRILAAIAAQK